MHITFQRSNKDPTFKFTLQDFLHSNQKLKDKAKLYISSQQWNNNRLLLFQSISDMRNPNNGKSFLQGRIKIFKIRMNQGIKNNHCTEGPESVCSYVTFTGCLQSNIRTVPIRAPVYPMYGIRQTNNGCMQVYFVPSPSLF